MGIVVRSGLLAVLVLSIVGCELLSPLSKDSTPPHEVSSLAVSALDGALEVTWQDPSDADLESIFIATGGQTLVVSKGVGRQRISGLSNGVNYSVLVRTGDKTGNKSNGVTTSGTPVAPVDSTPPGDVTNLQVVTGDGQVTLSWVEPADPDLASVEISGASLAASSVLKGTKSKLITGLTNGVPVTFVVKAVDAAGNKSTGVTKSATPVAAPPPTDTTAPANVTNLVATAGSGQIVVSWTDPADTDFASVVVSVTGGTDASVLKGTQTKTLMGLTNNQAYTVTVRSVDGNGNTSSGVSATTTPLGTWAVSSSAGSLPWWAVTLSSDGTKVAAAVSPGSVMTSSDSAVTWTSSGSGNRSWYGLTGSADGQKLLAAHDTGDLYTSTDGGATWTPRVVAGSHLWSAVDSSSDGTKLVAVAWGGGVYTSTDSGVTWTLRTGAGTRDWVIVASSSNGSVLYAVDTSPGSIYRSGDSGATWSALPAGVKDWYGVACSADGSLVVAVDKIDGTVVTSTDSGATWLTRTSAGQREWYSIALSPDGKVVAAGTYGGYLYLSTNGGETWVEQTAAGQGRWKSIAVSADGSRLVAGDFNTTGKLAFYR